MLIISHGETVTVAAHLFLDLSASIRASAAFVVHYASITRWEQQRFAWTQPDARLALTPAHPTTTPPTSPGSDQRGATLALSGYLVNQVQWQFHQGFGKNLLETATNGDFDRSM
ncbi:hypothetical protein [Amycolatopsis jejuensis]|uniref:hypothetical protein n=1 Tax=Amycolatopsis jejuensis TaxID=330084 RepID=UPI000525EE60